jgi:hypothetical protein
MIYTTRFSLLIVFLVFATSVAIAQKTEDVILKAMCDEMDRNTKELKSETNEKPFFIAYNAQDAKTLYIYATHGALMNTMEAPARNNNVRLIVGDYEFNDESLDNSISSPPTLEETAMPLENDYQGIRRSLWIATDNVFKGACKHFERNKLNLSEQKKQLSEIPHRSFAKVPVSEIIENVPMPVYDKVYYENYVRDLSAVFSKYSFLENSGVVLSYAYGNSYFVNSEGTRKKTYGSVVMLYCFASMKANDGDKIYDLVNYHFSGLDKLPSKLQVEEEIKSMIAALEKKSNAELFTEDYSGPVLFEGAALGELYIQNLFSMNSGLVASNTINTGNGGRNEGVNSFESKIGKLVLSDKMTIKAHPKTKVWNGIELLGSYRVDGEGVVPPDELVLVEYGILKNLLNDRTLTQKEQSANGHSDGPGVITFNYTELVSPQILKVNLIKEAKEQGLDYALIVKKIIASSNDIESSSAFEIYKVDLVTGNESFVRSAYLSDFDNKIFKRVMQASATSTVFNVASGGRNSSSVVSFISPDALLLKQVDVKGNEPNFFKEDIFVKSPLSK